MNLSNHSDHGKLMSNVLEDMRENFSKIRVFLLKEGQVDINKDLLQLFSPLLREIFRSIPRDSSLCLILPEQFSVIDIQQLEELLSTGEVSMSSDRLDSYNRHLENLVELGNLFSLTFDLSRIDTISSENVVKTERNAEYVEQDAEFTSIKSPVKQENPETSYHAEEIKMCKKKQKINKNEKPFTSDKIKIEKNEVVTDANSNNVMFETYFHSSEHHTSDMGNQTPVTADQQTLQQMPINTTLRKNIPTSFTVDTPPPVDAFSGFHMTHNAVRQQSPNNASAIFISPVGYRRRLGEIQDHRKTSRTEFQNPLPKKRLKKTFRCGWCRVFETPNTELGQSHFSACKRLNLNRGPLTCKMCKLTWDDPVQFHSHLRSNHKESVQICNLCEFTSFDKLSIKRHQIRYHQMLNLATKNLATKNLATKKRYNCTKCDYAGTSVNALKQHSLMKHVGKPLDLAGTRYGSGQEQYIKEINSWSIEREDKGWGPDDRYSCDYWNFMRCKLESGHVTGSEVTKVARFHVCALCYRNTGEKLPHPAKHCGLFPRFPQTTDRSKAYGYHELNEGDMHGGNSRECVKSSPKEEGEVD